MKVPRGRRWPWLGSYSHICTDSILVNFPQHSERREGLGGLNWKQMLWWDGAQRNPPTLHSFTETLCIANCRGTVKVWHSLRDVHWERFCLTGLAAPSTHWGCTSRTLTVISSARIVSCSQSVGLLHSLTIRRRQPGYHSPLSCHLHRVNTAAWDHFRFSSLFRLCSYSRTEVNVSALAGMALAWQITYRVW